VVIGLVLAGLIKLWRSVFCLGLMVLASGLVYGSYTLSLASHWYAPVLYLLLGLIACVLALPLLKMRGSVPSECIENQFDRDGGGLEFSGAEELSKRNRRLAKRLYRDRNYPAREDHAKASRISSPKKQ